MQNAKKQNKKQRSILWVIFSKYKTHHT